MSEIEFIAQSLQDCYDGEAWHGPNVKSSLAKIQPEQVNKRIGNSHSIIELVLHMNSWRQFVIEKLQDNVAYDVSDEDNFPAGGDWAEALQKLDASQSKLIQAIHQLGESKLDETVPGRKYSFRKLLHGIVHHDLYHLGQIVLIFKQS